MGRDVGAPPWGGGVADTLETRYSSACVITPNFVALGKSFGRTLGFQIFWGP